MTRSAPRAPVGAATARATASAAATAKLAVIPAAAVTAPAMMMMTMVVGMGMVGCTPVAANTSDAGLPAGSCIPYDPGCTPDPGSRTPNCAALEEGLDFAPFMIADFEHASGLNPDGSPRFVAQYMYSYFDGSVAADGKSTAPTPSGYEPAAVARSRCGDDPTNHVFHLTGGPFLSWGGGMGLSMQHLAQDRGLCPIGDIANPNRPSYCPPASANYSVLFAALNASEWDGIALWARRGPDSQPLLRVLVGTKDTDDDINYLMYDPGDARKPLYCRRVRDCACLFRDKACQHYDVAPPGATLRSFAPGSYCGAPGSTPGTYETGQNFCNTTTCDAVYPPFPQNGSDPQFVGRACTPFTYRNGTQTSICYNPGQDPPPPQPDEQCGDHWTYPLHLTTDWQLFLVPFRQMFQQGFGQRSPSFDLTSVSVVRLTWEAGFIDYWVDNLRFYRQKPAAR